MIRAKNLVKHFGAIRAVDDVSFVVEKGEVLGFLGPNGAGKTTTMKMLTGFLLPTSGTATICRHDILTHKTLAQRNIGYLPEGAPLYGEMTPASFLEFMARARGIGKPKCARAISGVAGKVGLEPVMNQSVETLSKGYQRRLALAGALLHDPKVLILDEPTDGLDPNQKFDTRNLIRDLAKDKAIIISTHILEEVESLCTRAIIIDKGKIVADSTPHALKEQSRYHNAVKLRGKKAGYTAFLKALKKSPGVAGVEAKAEDDTVTITVFAHDARPPVAAIQAELAKSKWKPDELSIDTGRLDDVFRSLTKAKEEAA